MIESDAEFTFLLVLPAHFTNLKVRNIRKRKPKVSYTEDQRTGNARYLYRKAMREGEYEAFGKKDRRAILVLLEGYAKAEGYKLKDEE